MSQAYRTPSLLEQFGLKPNPNKLHHVDTASGNRLTRVYTQGGHLAETEQKGLPVYHRRIGNPFPIIFISIGATLLIIGAILVGAQNLTQLNIIIAIGLPLGGLANFVGAMFAFAEGNTFAATLGNVFGGLIGSLCVAFLPWAGVQSAYLSSASSLEEGVLELYKALSFVFFVALIPVFIVFLAAFKTAVPLAGGALLICIAIILQGVNYLHYPMLELQRACGGLFIVVGVILFYVSVAVMNQEEDIMVPVFALPRHDD